MMTTMGKDPTVSRRLSFFDDDDGDDVDDDDDDDDDDEIDKNV